MSNPELLEEADNSNQLKLKGWSSTATILVGFGGFIVSTSVSFLVYFLGLKFLSPGFEKSIYFNFGLLVITDLAFLAVIFWYLRSIKLGVKDLGLIKRFKASNLPLVLAVAVGYVFLTTVISLGFKLLFPSIDLGQEQAIAFTKAVGPVEKLFAAVALLVVAPISEELIFRGFIFKGFRKQLGFLAAAVISSIFFGLIHGQINVALDTFALGLMLCYLYEKTQSIWPSIMLHSLKNGIAFYLLFFTSISAIW